MGRWMRRISYYGERLILRAERARINDLCAWGKGLEFDGYVRMEMDFELMLCDSFDGAELVSADYLAAWTEGYAAPSLSRNIQAISNPAGLGPHSSFPAHELLDFETISAGSSHNHYPGETRIRLDLTEIISFYDTSFAPSLIPHREGKERWDHRLLGISSADLAAVERRLRDMLTSGINTGSGVDWKTLYRVVVDRYADRLEMLEYLLNTPTTADLRDRARIIQTESRAMLTPYLLYTERPNWSSTADSVSYADGHEAWALPIWRACATRHTAHIHRSSGLQSRLTSSERLILGALDGTTREICRVLVRMWTTAGLDRLLPSQEGGSTSSLPQLLRVREKKRRLSYWYLVDVLRSQLSSGQK
ncbi:hypothetical protein K438DRAFT_2101240 [Mycena galopus ATCC 62051]|nr:hypothetical protein K438DRAFT_2101240 [Mycena galopus ATCC 62051]